MLVSVDVRLWILQQVAYREVSLQVFKVTDEMSARPFFVVGQLNFVKILAISFLFLSFD